MQKFVGVMTWVCMRQIYAVTGWQLLWLIALSVIAGVVVYGFTEFIYKRFR